MNEARHMNGRGSAGRPSSGITVMTAQQSPEQPRCNARRIDARAQRAAMFERALLPLTTMMENTHEVAQADQAVSSTVSA